jgi:hypothetical protein
MARHALQAPRLDQGRCLRLYRPDQRGGRGTWLIGLRSEHSEKATVIRQLFDDAGQPRKMREGLDAGFSYHSKDEALPGDFFFHGLGRSRSMSR